MPDCLEFERDLSVDHKTHLNFKADRPRNGNLGQDFLAIATQLSFNRIDRLETMCRNFEGPISAAIYFNSTELTMLIDIMSNDAFNCISQSGKVGLHLMEAAGIHYPTNLLRNLAVDNIPTQSAHYIVLDVDFVPSEDFSVSIRRSLGILTENSLSALVLPAFEIRSNK